MGNIVFGKFLDILKEEQIPMMIVMFNNVKVIKNLYFSTNSPIECDRIK